jgi:quercetin dioxygenase-like cupin family protein
MATTGQELRNPVTGQTLVFRRTSADTGGAALEVESLWEAGSVEPPRHYHPGQQERFRVLEGSLTADIAGEPRVLNEGDELVIPPNTHHSMWNAGPGRARASWVTEPALRTEEFFEAAWGLAAAMSSDDSGPPAMDGAELLREYSDVFRLAP